MLFFKLIEDLESIFLNAIKGFRTSNVVAEGIDVHNQPYDVVQVGQASTKRASGNQVVKNRIQNQETKVSTVKFDHQFKSMFNANLPKNIGVNVFGLESPPPNSDVGFRTITDTIFNRIIKNETSKLWEFTGGDDAVGQIWIKNVPQVGRATSYNMSLTDMSYFTPTIIKNLSTSFTIGGVNSIGDLENSDVSRWFNDFSPAERTQMATGIEASIYNFVGSNFNLISVPDNEPTLPIVGSADGFSEAIRLQSR